MQRWFWDIEKQVCCDEVVPLKSSSEEVVRRRKCEPIVCDREWTFTVRVKEKLTPNEIVCIVGNCPHLGSWSFSSAVEMINDNYNIWSIKLKIPSNIKTLYRYLICAIDRNKGQRIVRYWETQVEPHVIDEAFDRSESMIESISASISDYEQQIDEFGVFAKQYKVDRGWLTSEIIVQLKFFNAPFNFNCKKRLLYVKVTPVRQTTPADCEHPLRQVHSVHSFLDTEICKNDRRKKVEKDLSTAFAFCEVSSLFAEDQSLHFQPEYGTKCGENDLLYFHLTLGDLEHTVFLIDLYTYSSRAGDDEPPYHFGYQYVHSNKLRSSDSELDVKIICASRHRPIGRMQFSYLVMMPMPAPPNSMLATYERFWSHKWDRIEVGHRGLGTNFRANDVVIRENTISSIRNAQLFGADVVEFDVQLTKDLVPVVYHEYYVYISIKPHVKKLEEDDKFVRIPLSDLTYDQLQELHVLDSTNYRYCREHCGLLDDPKHYRPFPTLEELFTSIDSLLGFNIEVKWPQKREVAVKDLALKCKIDRNLYVDTILDVVFRKAGNRFIVFSSFDADTCTMLRFKQNRYPVMFINDVGAFVDPRTKSLEACIFNCIAMEFLGIIPRMETLLINKSKLALARDCGLIVFCWDVSNNKETIQCIKDHGINAVLYDFIHIWSSQLEGEPLFVVRADECEVEAIIDLAKHLDGDENIRYKSKEKRRRCVICWEKQTNK